MTEVISVRFRGGCKNYYFDPKGHAVKMGDQVIVETAQGPEFGTCTQGNHEVADEAVVQPLCAMLRLATDADRRTVDYNRKKESEAFDICEKKIADHGLEMKLVNVSASFDGRRWPGGLPGTGAGSGRRVPGPDRAASDRRPG